MNIVTFMPYIWIAVTVFSVIGEAVYSHMASICVVPGAILSLVFSLIGLPVWSQCLAFFGVSAILLLLRFTLFKDKFKGQRDIEAHPELLVGQDAAVIEPINNLKGCGRIKIHGTVWTACSHNDKITYNIGDMVKLIEYSVDRFICK